LLFLLRNLFSEARIEFFRIPRLLARPEQSERKYRRHNIQLGRNLGHA